jgi:carboxypeptidase T
MLKHVILIVALLGLAVGAVSQERYSMIRITVSSREDLRAIARLGIAMDHFGGRPGRWVDLFVSGQEIALLKQNSVVFTTLIDDWDRYYRDRLQQDLTTRSALSSPVKNFHLGSMGGYLTLSEIRTELDSMHAKYPLLITARDSIGSTLQHRPLWAVKISRNAAVDEAEPRALYTGLIHAREPAGMMGLIYYMWYLLENYGMDPEVTALLDHRELFFIPVLNPDGYAYNQSIAPAGGGGWRKNRSPNPGGTYGVDLNRNFGFQWGYDDVGSSPSPGSEVYRGTGPFSETETAAIRDFCNSKGLTNGITVALNYHTYGNLLIYPWGYADTDTEDSLIFRRMGEDMTSANRNTYGTTGQTVGYITNGDSDDWMYGDSLSKPRIFAMTPEVGDETDGFWALPSRILPIVQENLQANLYLAHAAGEFVAVGSNDVHFYPAGDSLRIDLTLINKGMSLLSSTVDIVAQSSDVNIPTPSIAGAPWQGVPVSIRATKSPWQTGKQIIVSLGISYQGGLTTDTLIFRLGPADTIYADDAETTRGRWTSSSNTLTKWDTTSEAAHSGKYSFTDSPRGNYPANVSSAFQLDSLFQPTGTAAELRFWTKWHIETNYDYATVEASTDRGVTWTPLRGKYTGTGSGVGMQRPEFSPGYDGIKHTWVEEVIDLDPQFMMKTIAFRFRMQSDPGVEFDGIFVDDIHLLVYPLGPAAVSQEVKPYVFALDQNYPNPFNPSTTIGYRVSGLGSSWVRLAVYDILGREMAMLVNEKKAPGSYSVRFDAGSLASGVYFYRLSAGNFVQTRTMLVIR